MNSSFKTQAKQTSKSNIYFISRTDRSYQFIYHAFYLRLWQVKILFENQIVAACVYT